LTSSRWQCRRYTRSCNLSESECYQDCRTRISACYQRRGADAGHFFQLVK